MSISIKVTDLSCKVGNQDNVVSDKKRSYTGFVQSL